MSARRSSTRPPSEDVIIGLSLRPYHEELLQPDTFSPPSLTPHIQRADSGVSLSSDRKTSFHKKSSQDPKAKPDRHTPGMRNS
jgi:hypothetical protein